LADPSADIFEREYEKDKIGQSFTELNIHYIMVDGKTLNKYEAENILPYWRHLDLPITYQDESWMSMR
jgi:hypothetical protein